MKLKLFFTLYALVIAVTASGCTVIDSGPSMIKTTMSGIANIAGPLVAKMDPTQITAGADGKVNDPRFHFRGHMGPAWVYDFELSLIGADASFDVDASGTGRDSVDPEVWAFIQETWRNNTLPEEERRRLITEKILEIMSKKAEAELMKEAPQGDGSEVTQ